jgi:hypothetical protein
MDSNRNFLFSAFEKIVMKPCQIDSDSQVVVEAETLPYNFVTFNTVKLSDAHFFMKDLQRLVEKLDEAVARIYRYGHES